MNLELDNLVERILSELREDDKVVVAVLKGHLFIEEQLDSVIQASVVHAEHLDAMRLSFSAKVNLARALCPLNSDATLWDLINAINSLRNDLAHNLRSPKRAQRLKTIRALLKQENIDEKRRQQSLDAPDEVLLLGASAIACGFLVAYRQDLERRNRNAASSQFFSDSSGTAA